MCCIIHRPKDAKEIAEDNLKKVIDKNPHGWGICFLNNDGEIEVEKSMDMTLAFDKVRELESQNKEFIFHTRWATHGDKNIENCHPFPIHNGVMFHNGEMKVGGWNGKMSDSWHFSFKITKLLKKMGKSLDYIIKERYKNVVGESRLAFMLKDGSVVKYGPWDYTKAWNEIDGCFYSKLDWQYSSNLHSGGGYGNYYGLDECNFTTPATKKVKKINIPIEELDKILDEIEKGNVLDEHIERLEIDDICTLNQKFSETMATYLYNLIRREDKV